jgi:hypothetical protein
MVVGSLVAPGTALPIKELVFFEFPPKPLVAMATQIQCAEDISVNLLVKFYVPVPFYP